MILKKENRQILVEDIVAAFHTTEKYRVTEKEELLDEFCSEGEITFNVFHWLLC